MIMIEGHVNIQRRDRGSRPPPPPFQYHKAIGFLSNTQGWEQSAILNQENIVGWLQNGEKQFLNHLLKV